MLLRRQIIACYMWTEPVYVVFSSLCFNLLPGIFSVQGQINCLTNCATFVA